MDKILVVEDDKTVYSGIKKLLELQHYSVVIAQNGMEALEKIDESFSLVIMDIMMPQLDGIETCRRECVKDTVFRYCFCQQNRKSWISWKGLK